MRRLCNKKIYLGKVRKVSRSGVVIGGSQVEFKDYSEPSRSFQNRMKALWSKLAKLPAVFAAAKLCKCEVWNYKREAKF